MALHSHSVRYRTDSTPAAENTQREMLISRNSTIDIAKGLGIILVVLGHSWIASNGNREIFRVIFSFHMPLFLFLSGIFLNESTRFSTFTITRIHSLLKPYFVILTALGLCKALADYASKKDFVTNFFSYMGGVMYGNGDTIPWPSMWYLLHLFLASWATLFIIKWVAGTKWRWIIAAILLCTGFTVINLIHLPWGIDLLPLSIPFLMAGYLCRDWVKVHEFSPVHLMFAAAVFALLHYFYDDTIDLNLRLYDSLFISTLQAALGIYLCLGIASHLSRSVLANQSIRLFGYIGSGTLFILIFHAFIQDKVFALLAKFMGETTSAALLGTLAAIGGSFLLWEFTKKSVYLSALLLPRSSRPRVTGVYSTPTETSASGAEADSKGTQV